MHSGHKGRRIYVGNVILTGQNEENFRRGPGPETPAQPVFNVPAAVAACVGFLVAVHLATQLVMDSGGRLNLFAWFAYIPDRWIVPDGYPGGIAAGVWSLVTHAFLHGGWEHLIFNSAWLLVFGSPVARRYGITGFVLLFVAGAIAGAAAFTPGHLNVVTVMVGASGAISALTGAAVRFVFQPIEYVTHPETGDPVPVGRRLGHPIGVFRQQRAFFFSAVWIGINLGTGVIALFNDAAAPIAWQAHIGGFVAGFIVVAWLERRWI